MIFFIIPVILFLSFMYIYTILLSWKGILMRMKITILIFFSLLSLNAYVIILVGWRASRRFSKIGSIRGILQRISYEITLILRFLCIVSFYRDFLFFSKKTNEMCVLIWIISWCILCIIERNRAPFDLLEGERELISGFNIEMRRINFVYIFLREYGIVIILSCICRVVINRFSIFFISVIFRWGFLFSRSCFPRIRYDTMIIFMWKEILFLNILTFFSFRIFK